MSLRDHAEIIWRAGLDAVRPDQLIRNAFADSTLGLADAIANAPAIHIVGGGKAGASMAASLEAMLTTLPGDPLNRTAGIVNVPEPSVRSLKRITLHPARPAGSNHPAIAGVIGSDAMLQRLAEAGPDDLAICLISGGGSAL